MAGVERSWRDAIAPLARATELFVERSTIWLREQGYRIDTPEQFAAAAEEVFQRWRDAWIELLPPNWRDLTTDEGLTTIEWPTLVGSRRRAKVSERRTLEYRAGDERVVPVPVEVGDFYGMATS